MSTSSLCDEVKPCTEDNVYAQEEKIKANQNALRKLCVTTGYCCVIVEEHVCLEQVILSATAAHIYHYSFFF